MAAHFRKYADQYDTDWLLAIAQGYQESQLISRSAVLGVRSA
jgi:membrane-bound lytic murein transglycosylase MltF